MRSTHCNADWGAAPRTIARLVVQAPASYAAFDLLASNGRDLRSAPLRERRAALEELAEAWTPPMNLSPATTDVSVAHGWFTTLAPAGIEGIVAKGLGQRYRGGQRDWVKVKHRSVVDVVCAAVVGPLVAPVVVVAGLPVGGQLTVVGRTTPLSPSASKSLASVLAPASEDHPWSAMSATVAATRFGFDREPGVVRLVEPVVVEVAADVAWSGKSFRHPLTYLRARVDLDPNDIALPVRLTP